MIKYFKLGTTVYGGPADENGLPLFGVPEGAVEMTFEEGEAWGRPPAPTAESLAAETARLDRLSLVQSIGGSDEILLAIIDQIPAQANTALAAIKLRLTEERAKRMPPTP